MGQRFRNLRLGTKQAIGFGLIVLILAGVNIFSVLRLEALKNQINDIATHRLTSAISIAAVDRDIAALRSTQLQHAFAKAEQAKQRQAEVMIDLISRIVENQERYEALITDDEERGLYSQFEEKWERYLDLGYQFLDLSGKNQNQQAIDLLNDEARVVFTDASDTLQQLVGVNQKASVDAAARAEGSFRTTRWIVRVLMLSTILLSILIARQLVRMITVPVQQLVSAAGTVARGNVDVQLDVESSDEIGRLSESFNEMTASLRAARDRIMKQQNDLQETNQALTEQKQSLEYTLERLREAQQQLVMKEKMASLGDLVAGVAHEINNPIGAIHSAAWTSNRSIEIVMATLEKSRQIDELETDKRFQKALHILAENTRITVTGSERITQIVKSLKNFARLDESEFQEADIHEGLDSTLTLLDHRMKNRIELRREYAELPKIACYPNQLNQVFMNVLSNAEQSIDGQGTITIRTSIEQNNIVVRITDTGRGIEEAAVSRIFDPGFTTKGVGVGTGLGLSISYNIVKKHNGDILVDSTVGQGTTLVILLPIEQDVSEASRG